MSVFIFNTEKSLFVFMYTYVLSADLGWRMAILPKKLETEILLSFLMLSRFLMDYYISYTYTMHYFILFI